MAQLTWITEFSTPFVNFHQVLTYHDAKDHFLYPLNGILMTIAFFVFRVIWYYYVIFVKLIDFAMYRHTSFWATYEPHQVIWVKISNGLYLFMYLLNLYWFSRMLLGFCKGLGIDQAIAATERLGIDSDEEPDEK